MTIPSTGKEVNRMPAMEQTAPQADLEFLMEQLAALEPMALGAEVEACNGCNRCAPEL
jgi:hypothetical protein